MYFCKNLKSMSNLDSANQALAEAFSAVEALFNLVNDAKINLKPTEKWSFGEEMLHLIMSTNGTALLLASPDERLSPSDHASRSYDAIVDEYKAKLLLNPTIGQAFADKAGKSYKGADLKASFAKAAQNTLLALKYWDEAKSDQWMVWKHPLLGKMTAREMVYFTVYHTRHHLATLSIKAA